MKQFLTVILTFTLSIGLAQAIPLQQAYDEAIPGAGYDKLIYLDTEETYTGGLQLADESVCIISAGAQVDLQGSRIIVDMSALLDICGVVLTNSDSAALKYSSIGQGWVDHCTFYHNYESIFFWNNTDLTITSNIISNSSHWGVRTHEDAGKWMAFNDAYLNTSGHYKEWCSG